MLLFLMLIKSIYFKVLTTNNQDLFVSEFMHGVNWCPKSEIVHAFNFLTLFQLKAQRGREHELAVVINGSRGPVYNNSGTPTIYRSSTIGCFRQYSAIGYCLSVARYYH